MKSKPCGPCWDAVCWNFNHLTCGVSGRTSSAQKCLQAFQYPPKNERDTPINGWLVNVAFSLSEDVSFWCIFNALFCLKPSFSARHHRPQLLLHECCCQLAPASLEHYLKLLQELGSNIFPWHSCDWLDTNNVCCFSEFEAGHGEVSCQEKIKRSLKAWICHT